MYAIFSVFFSFRTAFLRGVRYGHKHRKHLVTVGTMLLPTTAPKAAKFGIIYCAPVTWSPKSNIRAWSCEHAESVGYVPWAVSSALRSERSRLVPMSDVLRATKATDITAQRSGTEIRNLNNASSQAETILVNSIWIQSMQGVKVRYEHVQKYLLLLWVLTSPRQVQADAIKVLVGVSSWVKCC